MLMGDYVVLKVILTEIDYKDMKDFPRFFEVEMNSFDLTNFVINQNNKKLCGRSEIE